VFLERPQRRVTVHIPLLMGITGQSAARRLEVKKGLA
jgi:hypothetical protein